MRPPGRDERLRVNERDPQPWPPILVDVRARFVARPSENAERAWIRVVGGSAEPIGGRVTLSSQAVSAIQWLWSLSRLWVAVTNRHSDCAAALPLRMNRSTRRLYLICP